MDCYVIEIWNFPEPKPRKPRRFSKTRGTYWGQRIAELFFTSDSQDGSVFICKCWNRRKETGSSHANIVSHVKSPLSEQKELLDLDGATTQKKIQDFVHTTKAGSLYGWFDLIINALLPFSTVEKAVLRTHVKHKPISLSLSSFMRYLPKIAEAVEKKIERLLPDKFYLVFDGWTAYSTHFLAVSASYPAKTVRGYELRFLSVSPLENECRLDADEHIAFPTYILELYGPS